MTVPARLAVLAATVALAGCGSEDTGQSTAAAATTAGTSATGAPTARAAAAPDRFDEDRAFALVRRQVEVGPRPAGSPQLRRLAVTLRDALPRGRFENVPRHPGLRNVVGRIPGRQPAIVLGAHYDTQVLPEGFVGANDSASGTAAVIEIARALRGMRRPAGAPEIRFVLFDGEETPDGRTDDFEADGLRGSKAYVARHGDRTRALVLLDYIANKSLRLPREGTSDATLWRRVRSAANRAGTLRFFPDATGESIVDDHTPFLRAGIPAVDLIDWDYFHKNTERDTLDKLDVRSLDAVGETVVELLRTLR